MAAASGGQHALRGQLVRVQLPRRRMLANDLIHERLRRRRLVGLVVAVAAVAHQVDHHVLVELHAIFEREARDEAHRLGIVGIDVEIGASSIFATSEQYSVERASRGSLKW
jgi:hypothetical protein